MTILYIAIGFAGDGDCGEEATALMVSSEQERLREFVEGLLNPDRSPSPLNSFGWPTNQSMWNTYLYKNKFYHRVEIEPVDCLDG